MQYHQVGRTDVHLSAVGFGTCQLRMVPERQALDTLRRGFELGVNWVHASPDYGGVEPLVARAIADSGRDDLIPVANGWASASKLDELFERTCRIYGKRRLEVYGLSCIDDDDVLLHNNVWGAGGMVEWLLAKKREGRIGALFCSTHAPPDYVAKLIESGVFDAIMLAYNPLGFHALSYHARSEGKEYENLPENAARIFPLAAERQVSLLVMKPFAGGLLCSSKAFPPHKRFTTEREELKPQDILRTILRHPGVTAVVPGTASPAEAEENARAGHAPREVTEHALAQVAEVTGRMRTELCSRCGDCDTTCSKSLPISWLFREGYMWSYRADTFDAIDRHHYFRLHPDATLACATCSNRTCLCPHGIDIPAGLTAIHAQVLELQSRGLMHSAPAEAELHTRRGHLAARILYQETPESLHEGEIAACRIWLENVGGHCWTSEPAGAAQRKVYLRVATTDYPLVEVALRHEVHPTDRTYFAFELAAPSRAGEYAVHYELVTPPRDGDLELVTRLGSQTLVVAPDPARPARAAPARRAAAAARDERSYGVRYVAHDLPARAPRGAVRAVRLVLENTGTMTWQSQHPAGHSVEVGVFCDGRLTDTLKLDRAEVKPAQSVTVIGRVALPTEPGPHVLRFELVEQGVAVFTDRGVPPLDVTVEVEPGTMTRDDDLWHAAARLFPWHYQPTHGIGVARDGTSFPVFVERAEGCRIWDLHGKEYVDYTMGWGSTVLGYAHPRVQSAIADALRTGSLLAYPRPIDVEVSRLLIADFPGAEMVSFGKNGSDVCTLAARLCRAFTGRQTLLTCGYHGWGDFWVEPLGFAHTGVPDRERALVHRFRFNDADDFLRRFERYRDDLAGVMLEPSGPWGGDERGMEPDAEPGFLELLRQKTREAGALLVFDEIVTGYRHPGGSVQKARGVIPDLTCLGKAMASGMPLAALLGRRDVFLQAYDRTAYGPTFREEAWSLAAAKATIEVFHAEPVAQHVWDHGTRLREGIEARLRAAGIEGAVKGPPFRMSLVFAERDAARKLAMRTLLQQELLRGGVSIFNNGVMLPCHAHDDGTLARTLAVFAQALERVARASRAGDFGRWLEIPPLHRH